MRAHLGDGPGRAGNARDTEVRGGRGAAARHVAVEAGCGAVRRGRGVGAGARGAVFLAVLRLLRMLALTPRRQPPVRQQQLVLTLTHSGIGQVWLRESAGAQMHDAGACATRAQSRHLQTEQHKLCSLSLPTLSE